MNYSEIIDISLPIHNGMMVYPGNPEVQISQIKSETGNSVISKVHFGTHTGTHIDAPKHVFNEGMAIDEIPLETFMGPCRVIDCTQDHVSVQRQTLERQTVQKGERILLKTANSSRAFKTFHDDYVFVSPEASEYLATQEVKLVAIDYLSVKQRGSKDNRPHTNLLQKNIPIVEGVDLSQVEPGEYQLVILPLKFVDIDGAPARAVLLK